MSGSLIIQTRPYGFFSNFIHIIDNLKYCEIHSLKPIIDFDTFIYNNGKKNCWSYFFENVNDNIPVGDIHYSDIMKVDNFIVNLQTHKIILWDLCQSKDFPSLKKHQHTVNDCIQKNIKINKHIKILVENNLNQFPKNLLSVHIRCTDYTFYNFDTFFKSIDENINNFNGLFVASDSHEAINIFKNKYKNVFYYETSLRTNNISDKVLPFSLEGEDRFQHAINVLVECLLLSKSTKIICINSNVAACAAYFNPFIDIELLHRATVGG